MVGFLSCVEVGDLCIDVYAYAALPFEAHLFESDSKLMSGLVTFNSVVEVPLTQSKSTCLV